MAANVSHGETVNAKSVILAIVATEAVFGDAVALVTAALLPSAVLRMPAMCAIILPRNLLPPYLSWAALLRRPVVLLPLLVMLPLGLLLLLFSGVVLLLRLLSLLILSLIRLLIR